MQDVAAPKVIAEAIVDYDGLILALRQRKLDLALTDAAVDQLAGLASGHTGKLLGGTHVKTLGRLSLGSVLSTLAVKLVLVENEAARALVEPHWQRSAHPEAMRASKDARIGKMTMRRVYQPVVNELMRQAREARQQKLDPAERQRLARLAGEGRRKLDPSERQRSAQLAARARWAKQTQGVV